MVSTDTAAISIHDEALLGFAKTGQTVPNQVLKFVQRVENKIVVIFVAFGVVVR